MSSEANNKYVTFTLTLKTDGTPDKITASWKHTTDPYSNLNNTSDYPVVYLLGEGINGNRPSPEWKMEKNGSNYELTFTARDTRMVEWIQGVDGERNWTDYPIHVMKFDSKTSYNQEYGSYSNSTNLGKWKNINDSKKSDLLPGRRYKAVFNGTTLSITEDTSELPTGVAADNFPPYMSLVGYDYKQVDEYSTPIAVDGIKNGVNNGSGWQEAWLQFDKYGHVIKDKDNHVAYNTQWPPKYPAYFYVKANSSSNEYIEISSATLQMKPVEGSNGQYVMTGSQWKNYEGANYPIKDKSEYASLRSGKTGGVNGIQSLRDNSKYIRYVAHNVWLLGATKVWTGWGGTYTKNSFNQANWSNHANWGYGSKYEGNQGETFQAETPYNLVGEGGNFMASEPTYFGTVELFYCVDKNGDTFGETYSGTGATAYGAMYDGCIFYTTKAKGDAQILARNDEEYENAYYRFSANFPSQNVKSYQIFRRNVVAEGNRTDGQAVYCNKNGKAVSRAEALVEQNLSLNQSTQEFTTAHNTYTTDLSTRKQVETDLAEGRYRYEMEIVFADDSKAVVQSPVVTIANALTTHVEVEQLVKVKNNSVEGGYDYITFPKEDDGIVYGVKATEAEGKITKVTEYKGIGKKRSEMKDIYSDAAKSEFTDIVVITSALPQVASSLSTGKPTIGKYTLKGINPSGVCQSDADKYYEASEAPVTSDGLTFAEVCDIKLGEKPNFSLKLDYSYMVEDETVSKVSKPVENSGYLTVPTPKVLTAKILVSYVKDNTSKEGYEPMNFNFRGHNLTEARFQNVREYIEVEEPNVTQTFKGKVEAQKGMFNYTLGGTPFEIKDNKMIGKAVHPSNFYYEGTDNNYVAKTVHMTPSYEFCYSRWVDKNIEGIRVEENAPNTLSIDADNVVLAYDLLPGQKDNLCMKFDMVVKSVLNEGQSRIDNPIAHRDEMGENKGYSDFLLHHEDNDYFYVTIVEKGTDNIAKDINNNDAEFVASVKDLKKGKRVTLLKEYGHWYDTQIDDVNEHPAYQDYEVRLSFLYPFSIEEAVTPQGLNRLASDHSEQVIKSKAMPLSITRNDIATSVEGIEGVGEGCVKAGVGFIEVAGNGVEIYSAEGIKVAMGEGRHDLNAGVYVVRVSGRTQKVIVR